MRRYITVTIFTMIMLAALGMIFLMRKKVPEEDSFYITVNSQDGSSEMILPFYTEDDCAVFVLPSYAKIEEATFISGGMDIVGSDGTILVSSGMKCTSASVNCKYELAVPNDSNRKVLFLQSNGVAAMYIDTSEEEFEKVKADKRYKTSADIALYTDSGNMAYRTGRGYDQIRGRGNWTWRWDKKPYNIYLGKAADLLDMGVSNHWALVSNALDETNLRNRIAYQFAGKMAGYEFFSPECEYVDLYINGGYQGLYLLCERIEIAENRLTADDRDFLFCLDDARRMQGMDTAFLLNPGSAAEINHPDPCTQEEETTLKDHLMEMQNVFLQKEGSGSDPSWKDYIDLDSWARKYLVEEIFLNFDAGAQSQYFLWRREENKIYAGPCWDYDNILGVFGYGMTPRSFYARRIWKTSEQYTPWFGALWEKEEFAEYVKQLYRAEFLPELNRLLEKGIKKEADHIRNAANADRVRWPFLFKNHGSFQEAVDFMTDFLAQRTDFLSSAWIDNVEYCTITLKIPGDYYRFYCVRPGTVCQELPSPENFGLEGVKYWTYEDTGEIFSYGTTIREDLVLSAESKPQE